MDSQDRHKELAWLKSEQERLHRELVQLGERLREYEARPGEPVSEVTAQAQNNTTSTPAPAQHQLPPPVPARATQSAAAPVVENAQTHEEGPAHKLDALAKSMADARAKKAGTAGDWELNLGQVWFVRIGVGLVLTGLVFLSLYAYKNWIFNATALVKVSFFFAVSLSMVAGGYVIERWREHLRQYGQVLSAGGLAAGYYTIYAAHFVPALKVVGSPVVAAILLCLWAGGMLAYSAWRQGRILAAMSIGLAYYATVVNPSGWISLFSSLVLSAAAMVLLMRYRWAWVGAIGLIAAYLSHAFWTSMVDHDVTEPVRITYLTCTWLLFAVALQVPQSRILEQQLRRAMLGINNTAFWALVVFQIPKLFPARWLEADSIALHPHEHIGWISIGIGVGWMLIGALTWQRGGWRREYVVLWGFQGLLIATLGLMIEASGYSRFLMLSCEACILLLSARWIAPKWTRLAALLCFISSAVFALLEGIRVLGDPTPHWSGYLFTALFGFGFIAIMRRDVDDVGSNDAFAFYGNHHRLAPLAFAWIPWAMLIFGAILRWDNDWALIGLCAAPLLVAATQVFTKRREAMDAAAMTPLVLAAAGLWLLNGQGAIPSWAYGLAALMLCVYWLISLQLRDCLKEPGKLFPILHGHWIEWMAAVVLGLVLLCWFGEPSDQPMAWLFAAPALAIAGTVVYLWTRRPSLAAVLVFFHVGAIFTPWAGHLELQALQTAAPLLALLIHLAIAERGLKERALRFSRPLAGLAIHLALWGLVSNHDWPQPELWLGLLGTGWLAFSFIRKDAFAAAVGGLFPLIVVTIATLFSHRSDEWSPYPVLLILPTAALLTRQLIADPSKDWLFFRRLSGVSGLLFLGGKLSAHVADVFHGNGNAICWGLYAVLLFAVGLVFADKLFRRFGLFYLLIALIHILMVDVMKLDTLGRILSFLTLGAVLLLLGFLYNQFQEKIRKYL